MLSWKGAYSSFVAVASEVLYVRDLYSTLVIECFHVPKLWYTLSPAGILHDIALLR
jgi:hypothetical protein